MRKNNTGFAKYYSESGFAQIILILIIIAVAIGAYYFGTVKNKTGLFSVVPTPITSQASTDDLANWKTYTNEKYGFSIKYPNALNLYNDEKDMKDKFKGNSISLLLSPKSYLELDKLTSPYIFDDGFSIFVSNIKLISQEFDATTYRVEKVKISDVDATKVTVLSEEYKSEAVKNGKGSVIYYLDRGKYRYTLSYATNNLKDGYNYMFDQILSTFKFIE